MENEKRLTWKRSIDGFDDVGLCEGVTVGEAICKLADLEEKEIVEVVHGRWIPLEADGYADGSPVWDLWECSECREEHSGDEDTLTPYCPQCGAKMDGGTNDG